MRIPRKSSMKTGQSSLYDLLGVQQDASDEDIKKAYRALALRTHPDKNPGDPNASERFKALNTAYQVLSNPNKRKIYDMYGQMGIDMVDQIGEDNINLLLISQSKLFKGFVVATFLLTCCCCGCFCYCIYCCNFCCGKFKPKQNDFDVSNCSPASSTADDEARSTPVSNGEKIANGGDTPATNRGNFTIVLGDTPADSARKPPFIQKYADLSSSP